MCIKLTLWCIFQVIPSCNLCSPLELCTSFGMFVLFQGAKAHESLWTQSWSFWYFILCYVMLFYFIYLKHCIILNSVNSRWRRVAGFMCFSLCCLGPTPSSCHFFVYNIKFGFPDDKFFSAHVLFFFFSPEKVAPVYTYNPYPSMWYWCFCNAEALIRSNQSNQWQMPIYLMLLLRGHTSQSWCLRGFYDRFVHHYLHIFLSDHGILHTSL